MSKIRPTPVSEYYSGQGRLAMGERDPVTGRPLNMFFVGNVPALTLDISVTSTDHKEAMTGGRGIDLSLVTEVAATVNITMESFSLRNLVTAFWGSEGDVEEGTVADEPVLLKRGAVIALEMPGVSQIVITSVASGGGAGTEIDDTNYDYDPTYGTIYVKADAPDVPEGDAGVPATVAYKYSAHGRLDALVQTAPPERFLRFEGLNTISGDAVLVEIPRASFEPLTGLPLINDEVAQAELSAKMLQDTTITRGSQYYIQRVIRGSSLD